MHHMFLHANWASGVQAVNLFPPYSTLCAHRFVLELDHMCVKCHLRIECYIAFWVTDYVSTLHFKYGYYKTLQVFA